MICNIDQIKQVRGQEERSSRSEGEISIDDFQIIQPVTSSQEHQQVEARSGTTNYRLNLQLKSSEKSLQVLWNTQDSIEFVEIAASCQQVLSAAEKQSLIERINMMQSQLEQQQTVDLLVVSKDLHEALDRQIQAAHSFNQYLLRQNSLHIRIDTKFDIQVAQNFAFSTDQSTCNQIDTTQILPSGIQSPNMGIENNQQAHHKDDNKKIKQKSSVSSIFYDAEFQNLFQDLKTFEHQETQRKSKLIRNLQLIEEQDSPQNQTQMNDQTKINNQNQSQPPLRYDPDSEC